MDKSSGSWKRPGESHVYLQDVIAYALLAELATHGATGFKVDGKELNVGDIVAEAFARKAWSIGFYKMLGSRQSVMMRVDTAIYGPGSGNRPYLIYTDKDFQNGLNRFQSDLQGDGKIYDLARANILAGYVIKRGDWHYGAQNNRPYEWGNPTVNSPVALKNALAERNSWDSNKVLFSSGKWDFSTGDIYNLFFVVTKEQMSTLCGKVSCVTGQ
jgi:hypothetical protein